VPSRVGLSSLQRDILSGFLAGRPDFFLTGGAALIAFHGFQRQTEDLDLFSPAPGTLQGASRDLEALAAGLGAECRPLQTTPGFRRYLLQRQGETTVVDLVHDEVPQAYPEKPAIDGIHVDPIEEILINKICTLVSRSEVRDFWDVCQLAARDLCLETALEGAHRKDGGVTMETLVWVLSEVNWPAMARLAQSEGLSGWPQVEAFFQDLQEKLALRLLPE